MPKILVSIHCFAGDAELARSNLRLNERLGAPIVIMSPSNSPVLEMGGHWCQTGGGVGYIGQVSIDRQIRHLEKLLALPFEFYLAHDSDSVCLARELPPELFDGEIFWSNIIGDPRTHPTPGYDKVACQPPYFFSRSVLEKLLAVGQGVKAHPITPYIDNLMVKLSTDAGVRRRCFTELEKPLAPVEVFEDSWEKLYEKVRNRGCIMCHPIKVPAVAERLLAERVKYETNTLNVNEDQGVKSIEVPPTA